MHTPYPYLAHACIHPTRTYLSNTCLSRPCQRLHPSAEVYKIHPPCHRHLHPTPTQWGHILPPRMRPTSLPSFGRRRPVFAAHCSHGCDSESRPCCCCCCCWTAELLGCCCSAAEVEACCCCCCRLCCATEAAGGSGPALSWRERGIIIMHTAVAGPGLHAAAAAAPAVALLSTWPLLRADISADPATAATAASAATAAPAATAAVLAEAIRPTHGKPGRLAAGSATDPHAPLPAPPPTLPACAPACRTCCPPALPPLLPWPCAIYGSVPGPRACICPTLLTAQSMSICMLG